MQCSDATAPSPPPTDYLPSINPFINPPIRNNDQNTNICIYTQTGGVPRVQLALPPGDCPDRDAAPPRGQHPPPLRVRGRARRDGEKGSGDCMYVHTHTCTWMRRHRPTKQPPPSFLPSHAILLRFSQLPDRQALLARSRDLGRLLLESGLGEPAHPWWPSGKGGEMHAWTHARACILTPHLIPSHTLTTRPPHTHKDPISSYLIWPPAHRTHTGTKAFFGAPPPTAARPPVQLAHLTSLVARLQVSRRVASCFSCQSQQPMGGKVCHRCRCCCCCHCCSHTACPDLHCLPGARRAQGQGRREQQQQQQQQQQPAQQQGQG